MQPVRTTVLGALATVTAVALIATAAPSGHAAQDDIPVKGQAFTMGITKSGKPAVVTVHAVRRLEKATVVYWSLGIAQGSSSQNGISLLGAATTSFYSARVGPGQGDVGLTDTTGQRVFRPLQPGGRFEPCVCSSQNAVFKVKPGQASVVWSAVVPLPPEVTTVDVTVAEQVIPAVPVEDGPLEPLAATDTEPHLVGMGWPKVDDELLANARTPEPASFPLTSRISNLEATVTKSPGLVSLAADVLFAKDSATLSPKGLGTINAAAAEVKKSRAGSTLTVTGHADSDAADAHNLTLSKKRADSVAAALKKVLGAGFTFRTEGKGEKEPIADNLTPEGKAKNRRVTITHTGGN